MRVGLGGLLLTVVGAAALVGVAPVAAQVAPTSADVQMAPPLWLVAHGDSVTVQLSRVPEVFHGFHLYRGETDGTLTRITESPVTPAVGVDAVLAALGGDAPLLEDLTRSATPVQMARRLTVDPVTSAVYSYLFPSVAHALGRRYVDAAAPGSGPLRYRVAFVDAQGEETGEAVEGSVELRDVLPGAPTDLTGEAGPGGVTLEWRYPRYTGEAQDLVVGFHVYRREGAASEGAQEGAGYVRITDAAVARNDLASPAWADAGARTGAEYTYDVRAVDLLGREGPASQAVTVALTDSAPPSAPAALVALPDEGSVRLAWRIPPELTLAGYRVERSLGLDLAYAPRTDALIPADDPRWTDEQVVGGTQYFYRVVAVDAEGRESEPGNPVAAVPFDNAPPPAPVALRAETVDGAVRLQWTPPDGDDVLGYHVYRGEGEGTPVRLTSEPSAEPMFTDRGFEGRFVPGRSYRMRVTAVDGLLNESAPAEVEVTIPDDQAPGRPTGVHVRPEGGREMVVRWSPAPDLDVVRYVVYRAEELLGSVPATGPLRLRDAGAVPGVTHPYRVAAVDAAGNEGAAAEVPGVLRDDTPPPPTGYVEAALVPEGVLVAWGRVAAGDLAGYRVYRATTPTGVGVVVGDLVPPEGERRLTDPAGDAGSFYRVVAVDTSGNESRPSTAVQPAGGA